MKGKQHLRRTFTTFQLETEYSKEKKYISISEKSRGIKRERSVEMIDGFNMESLKIIKINAESSHSPVYIENHA